MGVTVTEERLATPDGTMPVKLFDPGSARGGLIVYMDAFGWREELDRLCVQWARDGYRTVLPDLFWRQGTLRFQPTPGRDAPLDPAMVRANLATTMAMTVADTRAILDRWAGDGDGRSARFGAVGYCMGARHALAAAARCPDRVRFAACLHGGRMVWDGAGSPHLLIPEVRGRLYVGFATDDHTCPDDHQALIARTIATSGCDGRTERFPAEHGWMFPDRWCWDPVAAAAARQAILRDLAETVDGAPGR